MKFADFAEALQLTEMEAARIYPCYRDDAGLEAYPEFLKPEFFAEYFPLCFYHTDLTELFRETAAKFTRADLVLANLRYRWLYCGETGPDVCRLECIRKPGGGIITLAMALAALPLIREKHRQMNLPEHLWEKNALWIGQTIDNFRRAHNGEYGQDARQTFWLDFAVQGRLFRIGRLEYLLHRTPDYLPCIYRSSSTGKVRAIARDGWELTSDGFRALAGEEIARTAQVDFGHDFIRGIPVYPDGRAGITEMVSLPLNEYQSVFSDHDYIPSCHMPGGGGMTPEAVKSSLLEAVDFFEKYLHLYIKGIVCESWVFNPQLAEFLPKSNIEKFQNEVFLFPGPPEKRCGLFFVFGRDDGENLDNYPAETSLQRAFHRLWQKYGIARCGGMFILRDEIAEFGSSPYRKPD